MVFRIRRVARDGEGRKRREELEAIASDPDLFLACMRIFRRAACDPGAYR